MAISPCDIPCPPPPPQGSGAARRPEKAEKQRATAVASQATNETTCTPSPPPKLRSSRRRKKAENTGSGRPASDTDTPLHSDPLPYVHPSTTLPCQVEWPRNPNSVSLSHLGPAVPIGHMATGMIGFAPFSNEYGVIQHRSPPHARIEDIKTIRVRIINP